MKHTTLFTFVGIAAVASQASSQCLEWLPGSHLGGLNNIVRDAVAFDDGNGPDLYVVGEFSVAGSVQAPGVVRWDGQGYSSLGSGLVGDAFAAVVFDDGTGPALYVAGLFSSAGGVAAKNIARWNGANWSALGLGVNSTVRDLAVFDDGNGAALYACGSFTTAGSVPARSVAKWNGVAWSAMPGADGEARALEVWDDGYGPRLYAATRILGIPNATKVARWSGSNWIVVGDTLGLDTVYSLEVHDDGTGSALYAGGTFSSIDSVPVRNLARLDGVNWTSVGGDVDSRVETLFSFDDGSGAKLYAGGRFHTIDGVPFEMIAAWDGVAWSSCSPNLSGSLTGSLPGVFTLTSFDDGAGPKLYVGGDFVSAGAVGVAGLAMWDGSWNALGTFGNGIDKSVAVLASIDLGAGSQLYAGGFFLLAGGVGVNGVASWDGVSWSALGSGVSFLVRDLCGHDDGSGPALYAVGSFESAGGVPVNNVARWNGSAWSSPGVGVFTSYFADQVMAVASFDDGGGPALFVGGTFDQQTGGAVPDEHLVFWRGGAWHTMPVGEPNSTVRDMIVFDDGSGPALYVAGDFWWCGGMPMSRIARWNGTNWSALAGGVDDDVSALAVFDDGGGPALYASGAFAHAGGAPAARIAKWNGTSWSALGSGLDVGASVLAVHDDGSGNALFAGGSFAFAGGAPARHIAKWNGTTWSTLGTGVDGAYSTVYALASFADGRTPTSSLYAGGYFSSAGNYAASNIATWSDPCICSGASYCTSGTTSNGCAPTISGSGRASASAASGFTISVDQVEGGRQGHIFYGLNGSVAYPWGTSSHYLCVKAPTQRTGTQDSGGTAGACNGVIALDWNAYTATHPYSLGVPFSAGATVWAQAYFRDPPSPKTTALSNALRFTVCP